jgi:hypothetical protein
MWAFFALILFVVLLYFESGDSMLAAVDTLAFSLPMYFLALSLWYVVRYTDVETVGVGGLLLHHVSAAIVVLALWLSLAYYLEILFLGNDHLHPKVYQESVHWILLGCFVFYDFIVICYYLLVYYRNFQEKRMHESELENLVKEAELSALKSQINPHFLFNSLNSVSSLTISDPERARDMVVKLSSYLRYSLGLDLKEMNSLRNEMENSKLYLQIERVRFGDRLQLKFDLDENCKELRLPNLILQPIFENAIKHGVHESTDPVTITTRAQLEKGMLCIRIGNNFDSEAMPRKGNGIGLKNIQERLQLIFSRSDLMRIVKTEEYFEVNLKFPQEM